MISRLEDFKVYNLAMELGEVVWNVVGNWDAFQRNTIGVQLVRATDSIAANLSEGLGRFHFKESKNFSYFSRGSLFGTKTWLTKANRRKLIGEDDIELIGRMLNAYIKSIGHISEPLEEYNVKPIPNT